MASLVGGGVCIWDIREVSIASPPGDGHGFLVASAFDLFSDAGPGEDDSLREGSTGGKGKLLGTK